MVRHEHELADARSTHHTTGGGLFERKCLKHDRCDYARFEQRPHSSWAHARSPFSASDRGRSVDPVTVSDAAESHHVDLRRDAAEERDLHEAAVNGKRLDVARDVLAADHIEDEIDAAASRAIANGGHEISLAIVDGELGAESLARRALLRRPRRGEHARPKRARQLNRRRPNPLEPPWMSAVPRIADGHGRRRCSRP
jgi:hypothetical protein